MFIDNEVKKSFDDVEKYDKFAIAAALFEVSLKGAACSLIESNVLVSCDSYNLKYICKKVDELVEDYTRRNTVVRSSFKF